MKKWNFANSQVLWRMSVGLVLIMPVTAPVIAYGCD